MTLFQQDYWKKKIDSLLHFGKKRRQGNRFLRCKKGEFFMAAAHRGGLTGEGVQGGKSSSLSTKDQGEKDESLPLRIRGGKKGKGDLIFSFRDEKEEERPYSTTMPGRRYREGSFFSLLTAGWKRKKVCPLTLPREKKKKVQKGKSFSPPGQRGEKRKSLPFPRIHRGRGICFPLW